MERKTLILGIFLGLLVAAPFFSMAQQISETILRPEEFLRLDAETLDLQCHSISKRFEKDLQNNLILFIDEIQCRTYETIAEGVLLRPENYEFVGIANCLITHSAGECNEIMLENDLRPDYIQTRDSTRQAVQQMQEIAEFDISRFDPDDFGLTENDFE